MASSDEKTECKKRSTYMNSHSYLSDSDDEEQTRQEHDHQEEETQRTKIARAAVIAIVITVTVLSSTGLVFDLLRPAQPSIQLDSFALSNFGVNETRLSYDWKANYTVTNPDSKFSFILSDTFSYLSYKGHVMLSAKAAEEYGHKLSPYQKGVISFKKFEELAAPPEERNARKVLKDIMADLDGGKGRTLSLELSLWLWGIAMADSWWGRQVGFHVSCGNTTVRFVSDMDAAAVLSGNGRTCFIDEHEY